APIVPAVSRATTPFEVPAPDRRFNASVTRTDCPVVNLPPVVGGGVVGVPSDAASQSCATQPVPAPVWTRYQVYPEPVLGPPITVPFVPAGSTVITVLDVLAALRIFSDSVT